jgi:hypothetical protein
MPSAADTTDALRRRASEAYWSREETVDEIADRLGMSRSALYSAIAPVPAGAACEACSGALVYNNRTGRSAGRAVCAECGAEAIVAPQGIVSGADDAAGVSAVEPAGTGRFEQLREGLAAVSPERAAMIGGAAALGVAVGAAAARAVRKRS